MSDDWVIVDTCIWASFLGKPASAEKRAVDQLIDDDRVLLIGPILTEVLLGFRREDQARWISSRLRLTHYAELTVADWQAAAAQGRRLAAKGYQLPITDLVIAAVAERLHVLIYTTDPHFDLMPQLNRYVPSS